MNVLNKLDIENVSDCVCVYVYIYKYIMTMTVCHLFILTQRNLFLGVSLEEFLCTR